jgi:hypothetical protein
MTSKNKDKKPVEQFSQVPGSLGKTENTLGGQASEIAPEENSSLEPLEDGNETPGENLKVTTKTEEHKDNPNAIEVRDPEMKISDHITYKEAIHSDTADELGIDNNPPDEILEVMKITAEKVFEPLRRFWKCLIAITSFFRCAELNAALEKDKTIRASKNSQHMSGEAMDINANVYGNISNRQVFEYIRDHCIFDQLIWEYGDDGNPEWVHASYRNIAPRMMVLRHFKVGSRTYYEEIGGEHSNFKSLN